METLKGQSDLELVDLYMDGNHRAGNEIVTRYYKTIRGYLNYKLKYSMMVDDIVQETFLKVLKKIRDGKYDINRSTMKNFCYTVAFSTMIDSIRTKNSGTQLVSNVRDYGGEEFDVYKVSKCDGKSIELEIEEEQKNQIVYKLLEDIEYKYRIVLHLTFFEEKTQREIADDLDIPLGTVKSRLKAGLRRIRESEYFNEFIYELR